MFRGKSKVLSKGTCDDSLVMEFLDDVTAFNGEKKAVLAGKGALCAGISGIIFRHLEVRGVPTHFIKDLDENTMLVKKAEIIPVEVIVRNVAAGGFAKKYGVADGAELANKVLEFCYKSDELGDPLMNESQITAIGLAAYDELQKMASQALKVNEILSLLFANAGIQLVDFKLEFGRCQGGIILCDEISPDSCRLWDAQTGERLDKDRFRLGLPDVLNGYQEVLKRIQQFYLP
ncbi:MAG: phosphoribosylaminoimidazolesuccinocarboxamide synthase [Defluviitaleaceae bacterium]|nr:phosphoribosylaminoimidazolesuccinocarboxamide synthase [Defluviitaleaceae bacterium]